MLSALSSRRHSREDVGAGELLARSSRARSRRWTRSSARASRWSGGRGARGSRHGGPPEAPAVMVFVRRGRSGGRVAARAARRAPRAPWTQGERRLHRAPHAPVRGTARARGAGGAGRLPLRPAGVPLAACLLRGAEGGGSRRGSSRRCSRPRSRRRRPISIAARCPPEDAARIQLLRAQARFEAAGLAAYAPTSVELMDPPGGRSVLARWEFMARPRWSSRRGSTSWTVILEDSRSIRARSGSPHRARARGGWAEDLARACAVSVFATSRRWDSRPPARTCPARGDLHGTRRAPDRGDRIDCSVPRRSARTGACDVSCRSSRGRRSRHPRHGPPLDEDAASEDGPPVSEEELTRVHRDATRPTA
jgi:hypothetical protein